MNSMRITAAQLYDGGVTITRNGTIISMPDGYTGWLLEEYNEWLAVPNTPDPIPTPSLSEYKDAKKSELRAAFGSDLTQGYWSDITVIKAQLDALLLDVDLAADEAAVDHRAGYAGRDPCSGSRHAGGTLVLRPQCTPGAHRQYPGVAADGMAVHPAGAPP